MVSRNNLIGGPTPEEEAGKTSKPFRTFAYNAESGDAKLFTDRIEYQQAVESLQWVDTPTKSKKMEYLLRPESCPHYINRNCSLNLDKNNGDIGDGKEEKEEVPGGRVEDKEPKTTSPETPEPGYVESEQPSSKYISQMNKTELVAEGKKYGLYFESETKREMRKQINAKKEQLE